MSAMQSSIRNLERTGRIASGRKYAKVSYHPDALKDQSERDAFKANRKAIKAEKAELVAAFDPPRVDLQYLIDAAQSVLDLNANPAALAHLREATHCVQRAEAGRNRIIEIDAELKSNRHWYRWEVLFSNNGWCWDDHLYADTAKELHEAIIARFDRSTLTARKAATP